MIAIITSALLCASSFVCPALFGWAFLIWWIPLVHGYKKVSFVQGCVWGGVAYSCYFFWFLILLLQKSFAAWWMAVTGYLVVVAYFALSSGIVSVLLAKGGTGRGRLLSWDITFFCIRIALFQLAWEGFPFLMLRYPWLSMRGQSLLFVMLGR
ncbi:MAG: hypothetical protein US69_C0005G0009 [candidate division TM6 bacterium GW2011_GWF2_38_10]|nr:MAG: hypothetical protein US69_C0005G0009 [candidate division TM6 bacterium GW2011_GWF2_38_10]